MTDPAATQHEVVLYPDRFLKRSTAAVDTFDEASKQLAEDLLQTMYASPGCVGLAAPQIAIGLRVFSLDVSVMRKPPEGNHGAFVIFNPAVSAAHGREMGREGCLSVPEFTCNVERATDITIEGYTADGSRLEIAATGFEARAIQHELDHLDGKLILDRVSSLRNDVFRRKNRAKPGEHLK